MKRRNFISTTAAITATACLSAAGLKAEQIEESTNINGKSLNLSFGFFDVDTLELASGSRSMSVFPQLSFRERTVPLTHALNALHELARKNRHPFVFTTCCSGKMPDPQDLSDVLYIPSDVNSLEWKNKTDMHSMFYLEKNKTGAGCYDMFNNNSNAALFFPEMKVDRWVLFGNGAELCILNDAVNILKNGCRLIILSDVLVYSAKGYGLSGTPAGRAEMLEKIKSLNGEIMTLGEFFQEYNYTITGAKWDPDLQKTIYK